MTKLLATPAMQFELPDGLDYIFDNTPLSPEDLQRITEMIQKLKAESVDSLTFQVLDKKTKSTQILSSKEETLKRRREHYISKKTGQKSFYTEGS